MSSPQSILVVEDEPLIAMMIEDFLDVLGKSALELVDAGGIDAAILDVNLRGGEKSFPIAEALAARNIPFVFATGGSHDSVGDAWADRPTLPKPFTMDGVAKALDSLG
jgi:DNA-binding response OmpR family regulator